MVLRCPQRHEYPVVRLRGRKQQWGRGNKMPPRPIFQLSPILVFQTIDVEDVGHVPSVHHFHRPHTGKTFDNTKYDDIELFLPNKPEKAEIIIIPTNSYPLKRSNFVSCRCVNLIIRTCVLLEFLGTILKYHGKITILPKFPKECDPIETWACRHKQDLHDCIPSRNTESNFRADASQLYVSRTASAPFVGTANRS